MGVNSFPSSDLNKFRLNSLYTQSTNISLTTAFQTVLSVTGKGFLDHAAIAFPPNTCQLRVTVDGVVKILTTATSGTNVFANRKIASYAWDGSAFVRLFVGSPASSGTASNVTLSGGATGSYPDASGVNSIVVSSDAIYFNSSLLIEAKGNISGTGYYAYSGGYQ